MKALHTKLANQRIPAACGALLLWVALAPFLWGYWTTPAAVASHVFFLFAFGPLTLIVLNLRPAAYVLTAAGSWLALSPWLLGYATNHTAWLSDGITGILFTSLAAHAAGVRVPTPARKRRHAAAAPPVLDPAGSRS
jgi:hypothetical protein